MKKYIVFTLAAMMLLSAISARAQEIGVIDIEVNENNIPAAAANVERRYDKTPEALEIQRTLLEVKGTLGHINAISEEINLRLTERFSSDSDKGDVADGAAKIGTEVSTANELVRELDARIPTKIEADYVLKSLRTTLSDIRAVNQMLQN